MVSKFYVTINLMFYINAPFAESIRFKVNVLSSFVSARWMSCLYSHFVWKQTVKPFPSHHMHKHDRYIGNDMGIIQI